MNVRYKDVTSLINKLNLREFYLMIIHLSYDIACYGHMSSTYLTSNLLPYSDAFYEVKAYLNYDQKFKDKISKIIGVDRSVTGNYILYNRFDDELDRITK